jgi:hypothetical protein
MIVRKGITNMELLTQLFTLENLNIALVIIFVLGLIIFAARYVYLIGQDEKVINKKQRQLMSQHDYIEYCYNCECEGVKPLKLNEINQGD